MQKPSCCSDHDCDLCATCMSGTCCLTVASGVAAATAVPHLAEHVREAVIESAATAPLLPGLIRMSVGMPTLRQAIASSSGQAGLAPVVCTADAKSLMPLLLPPAQPARAEPVSTKSTRKKEA